MCGLESSVSELQFRYCIQIDIRDGTVTLPLIVYGDAAAIFFRGIPPVDMWSNHQSHQMVLEKLDRLVASKQATLFGIQCYVPHGKTERVYQLLQTILL